MTIALIIRKLAGLGGAQRVAVFVADELRKRGHEVVFYTFSYEREVCFPDILKSFRVVELPKKHKRSGRGLFGFRAENKMARDLSKCIDPDTDILFPHDGPAHHVSYYFKKDVKNIPSVWEMNELPTMRWPLELLSIVENPDFHDIPRRPLWFKKAVTLVKTAFEKKFIRAQDEIVVFDEFHKNMLERYIGVSNIIIIPTGNDPDAFSFQERTPPKRNERLRLLSSGIFLSYRRFEDAIRALAILRTRGFDSELAILGDYTTDKKYYEKLKELCEELGVSDRVAFVGRYSDQQLLDYLKDSHVFVYPHLQSQGIAANETIAAGLPTIVTPLLGTYETLEDGTHALFAEARNPDDLADKVQTLVDDAALYERISREGSRHLRGNFSWARQARELLEVFEKRRRYSL